MPVQRLGVSVRRAAPALSGVPLNGSESGPGAPQLLSQASRLLAELTGPHARLAQTADLSDAVSTYEAVIVRAAQLRADLPHYAALLSLALDLHSGPSALLAWQPTQREGLLAALGSVLRSPAWAAVAASTPTDPVERRRTQWIRRTGRRPFLLLGTPPPGLHITVVASDPAGGKDAETRTLLDGRPLLPQIFGLGPACSPESLLDTGSLRTTPEPHEVRLAEAYCTEGCCGALYVTIRRAGDDVVWSDWRFPNTPATQRHTAPVLRFDATAYDTEITRAENDRWWSRPYGE
jgi:hypothetical protein